MFGNINWCRCLYRDEETVLVLVKESDLKNQFGVKQLFYIYILPLVANRGKETKIIKFKEDTVKWKCVMMEH